MSKFLMTESGKKYKIIRSIDKGKQAEVLEIQDESTGKRKAAKLFFPNKDPVKNKVEVKDTKERLRKLIKLGTLDKRLVMPEDIISDDERAGYVMELLPPKYVSLLQLINRKMAPDPEFHIVLKLCINICLAFEKIHDKGLYYGDISFANIRISAEGDVKIIDCDNLNLDGMKSKVLGSPYFQPPEIVRGDVTSASIASDKWALAVLLFFILYSSHPLLGKREQAIHCYDPFAEKKLLGLSPLYIFSRTDQSNWPDPDEQKGALECFLAMPAALNQLFEKAFTAGLDQAKRVSEADWLSVLYGMAASIIRCPKCSAENFFDKYKFVKTGRCTCSCCNNSFSVSSFLDFGKGTAVPVWEGNTLFLRSPEKGLMRAGKFVINPKTGGLGLENSTGTTWKFTNPKGEEKSVAPGMKLSMNSRGSKIQFKDISAIIRVNTHK